MTMNLFLVLSMIYCSLLQTTNAIVPGACKAWQYRCQNGECIDLFLLCDGGPDCQDGSDELKCGSQVNQARQSFFRCRGDGRLVASFQRCDGEKKCQDGSDEWNCPKSGQCMSMQYRCNDGTCILGRKVCDRIMDCNDGSDELFCSRLQNLGLHTAWVLGCDTKTIKSPHNDRCDGVQDCDDLSDEANCTRNDTNCKWNKLKCDHENCVDLITDRCDGHSDCSSGLDEANCQPVVDCNAGEFTCDNAMCVPLSTRCDGRVDCGDASDEWNCPKLPQSCSEREFQCDNGRCVPKEARCDGLLHCADASDEWECADLTAFCKAVIPGYTSTTVKMSVTSGERTALILALVVIMVLLVLFFIIIYLGAKHLRRLKDNQMNLRVSLSGPGKSSPPREFM